MMVMEILKFSWGWMERIACSSVPICVRLFNPATTSHNCYKIWTNAHLLFVWALTLARWKRTHCWWSSFTFHSNPIVSSPLSVCKPPFYPLLEKCPLWHHNATQCSRTSVKRPSSKRQHIVLQLSRDYHPLGGFLLPIGGREEESPSGGRGVKSFVREAILRQ